MFVGRDSELEALEELYASDTFQFPVVYGRRRVGNTTTPRDRKSTRLNSSQT